MGTTVHSKPELRKIVVEAAACLAKLDSERLEELALSCQSLNRSLGLKGLDNNPALAAQAREASAELAVLGRVLDATRSNLEVMRRLREARDQQLEYSVVPPGSRCAASGHMAITENGNGYD